MFAKTFRVHQIFTRARHSLVKSKLIQDTHLLVIIGVLLAVDSAMVFVWVIADPMSRQVDNTTREVSSEDEDLIYQDQLTTCHSDHLQKWLGAFYAYKGLLLVFGVYMAWETRHVKIPALNDSQYIGLNVYNVVIMSVSVVVISNFLSSQPTLAYAMEAAFIILSTTVTLCLLFVPKIYAIVTSGGNPIIASTGILVDNSNTRRFVFDERKDIFYRAEVRNRVYKREIAELDHTINQLQHLLRLPLQLYPRLTEELMYLLPETTLDGTPTCHKRYKKRLERCVKLGASDNELKAVDSNVLVRAGRKMEGDNITLRAGDNSRKKKELMWQ
ncbi:gamma-aminobutyric acid type B receptor subunit [Elysia marginata]|uniref:Gamma-aminobutyric acid type B receptor subunit n=1 Tax=Elysia marginata TaxID=1093978 RepID=A0AAV4IMM4_9GAST|nr:gamma-aminobutyric acid type B receptor subunit [Elysia marginata]